MKKNLRRIVAGTLSALLVGQVMIFGDGGSQGILHADTIASAAEAIEGMKNAKQLAEEFDTATRGLGEVDYFSTPDFSLMTLSEDDAEIVVADSLTITGRVQKGTVDDHIAFDTTKIYVRIFNGDWQEIASTEVNGDGGYSVTAGGSDVYHVKYECDGYLPFYLKDFGTGAYLIGSGDSNDTVTLVPGDTTYNAGNGNLWSDDRLDGSDKTYAREHIGARLGDPNFNPTMDIDGDGIISDSEKEEFDRFYDDLVINGNFFDMTGWSVLSYDIDLNGVINEHDYDLLYDMTYHGLSTAGWNIPDFVNGVPTEGDLAVFRGKVDAAHIVNTDVYIYNHEMTGNVLVNADDFNDTSRSKINAAALLMGPYGEYLAYMDKDADGTIYDTDYQWFKKAYDMSGDLDWDRAFKKNITVLENGNFPYSLNLHDTNLDLNGCALFIGDCMSFTTDIPEFWMNGEGAELNINGGMLYVENNLVFRTASPDGWAGDAGQMMNLNGGTVYVGADFNFGQANCSDTILMTNEADQLIIEGNWNYITLADMEGKWTAGQIWFLGPTWEVNELSGKKSIYSSGTQSIIFGYEGGKQTILWDNPETYINNEDGSYNTNRWLNFDYEYGILFTKEFTEENYWFRPWWRPYNLPDYTLYRKGWEIGDGVHIATGNYTKSFTDLSVASPGVKSDFVRTYNSMSDEEGSFGIGWDFNIDVSKIVIPAEGYYQVVLPDGSNTPFKDDGNGGFECLNARSTMTKSGEEYTITNAAQSQYHFNANHELDWVKDANGNILHINTLSDMQKQVVDSTGRTYTITYRDVNGHKRIESIADENSETNRIVNYAYNDNAQLISATSVSGGTEHYEYDGNGRLCKITNCYDEVTDQMVYNNNGSVNWLTNAAGLKQVYTYNKAFQQTGLKEYDGETLVKTFTYDYDEKYAVRTNTVETDGTTYEVDKITYNMVDGENKYDEMSESVDIMGNTTKYIRDENGNVKETINPDGTHTLAKYNDKNMPVVQVDESGNATVFVYDASGVNVIEQYQSLTTVDANTVISNPAVLTYDNSAVTYYTYYSDTEIKGLVHEITDPDGYVTEYVYGTDGYSKGLPTEKNIKDGNEVVSKVQYEYNSQLQVSKETTWVDIANNVKSVKEYEYDNFNNVTKVSDYGTGNTAAVTVTEYDLLSRKTAEYTPNFSADKSAGTLYTYYPSGAVKSQTDALGSVTSYEYDAYGNATSKTNPDGTINITEYDGLQREKATYFKYNSNAANQILTTTSYLFDTHNFALYTNADTQYSTSYKGLRTTKTTYITAAKQVVTETLVDFRGNPVEEKTNGETKRTSAFYQNGQLARQTDALGNTTKYEYNYLNKLTKTTVPFTDSKDSETENTYDKRGNVIKVKQTVQAQDSDDVKYSITQNQYNALGLLTQVTLSGTDSSERNISQYFYNNAGVQTEMRTGLSSETDTEYLTTNYEYDAWMRLVRTTDSTGYNSGTITYDLNGNVLSTTDANGNVTTSTYDALNRVLTSNAVHPTDSSRNVSKSYTYDNMGRIKKAVNNGITTTYQYDSLGRKSTEAELYGNNSVFRGFFYEGVSSYVSSELTGLGNILIYSDKHYTYDAEMRVSAVKESSNDITAYTYDAGGNKLTETMANGVVSTYSYNKANKVTGIVNTSGDLTISEYEYSYYLDGSDACKKRTEDGIIEVTSYEYDGLKRLTQEAVTTGSTTDTYTYEYDDYGNRAKMTATGSANFTTVYDYTDAQGNYTALLQKEVKTSADKIPLPGQEVTPEQTVYTYDANGSQLTKTTSEKTETNVYNAANQLVGFADGETTASYAYNSNGLRVEKIVDGQKTNHVWDGSQQIVADIIDSEYYEAQCYIRGTSLAATYRYQNAVKSGYTYYVQNAHGDVVNLVDADGAVTKTYHYDAFGVELSPVTGDVNVFRYCGEYFDTETGSIYLRARYYQASIGRFTQRDTIAGKLGDPLSLNLYTYCQNNPIFYFDPSGHKSWGKTWEDIGSQVSEVNYNLKRASKIAFPKYLQDSKKTVNKVQKFTSKFNYTNTHGISGNIGFMNFSLSASAGLGFDAKGNIYFQVTTGHGASFGLDNSQQTPLFSGPSVSYFNSTEYVQDYSQLNGYGLSTGGSGGGVPEVYNLVFGLDLDWNETEQGNTMYAKFGFSDTLNNYKPTGYTGSLSWSATPTAEVHKLKTGTRILSPASYDEHSVYGNIYYNYYNWCDKMTNYFNELS